MFLNGRERIFEFLWHVYAFIDECTLNKKLCFVFILLFIKSTNQIIFLLVVLVNLIIMKAIWKSGVQF